MCGPILDWALSAWPKPGQLYKYQAQSCLFSLLGEDGSVFTTLFVFLITCLGEKVTKQHELPILGSGWAMARAFIN